MNPEVSVILISYNEEDYIHKSINNILDQSFRNLEIIVIDDHSTDKTFDKIISISDKRLKIIRNEKNLGPVISRNKGILMAKGKYIFFTDGDCYPYPNWIFEGLRTFKKFDCLGVEGKIVMDIEVGRLSDKVVKNTKGNEYMTGNVAYTKKILNKINGFNYEFNDYYEDREIALRVLNYGKIIFNENMVVKHQLKKWNFKGFLLNAKKVKGLILLYKRYNWSYYNKFRIIKPKEMLLILFPPFILALLFEGRVRSLKDFMFLPLVYFRAVYMRLIIWKTAYKERVFLL